jgi:hypothetical protein
MSRGRPKFDLFTRITWEFEDSRGSTGPLLNDQTTIYAYPRWNLYALTWNGEIIGKSAPTGGMGSCR